MKQTTLEDLYYGNINPNEISFVRGSEYDKCFEKVTELSKSVMDFTYHFGNCYLEVYVGKLNKEIDVSGDENELYLC